MAKQVTESVNIIEPRLRRSYSLIDRSLARLDPQATPWASLSPGSPGPRGDILVFPGSFNPPTLAHLAILRQARKLVNRQGGHWRAYVALSKQIVDKEAIVRMTLLDRVVLLERVLRNEVRDAGILLLNRGLYVDQARCIRRAFPQVRRLVFVLGFDKIIQILDPHYYTDRERALRELFAEAELLVAPRGSAGTGELEQLLTLPANRPFVHAIHPLPLPARYREISSTQAREGVEDESGSAVLPEQVRDFIVRTRPYEPPLEIAGAARDLYAERTSWLRGLVSD